MIEKLMQMLDGVRTTQDGRGDVCLRSERSPEDLASHQVFSNELLETEHEPDGALEPQCINEYSVSL